ncbi:hypothetical protein BKA56DRAFT_727767 [Ilyonectria sp. MPI-CAGE-AT-0026]|nr:hypothetical protein BKA56DRAFT_727767 [Ilyonectria sp. MPI-CAGE-AT-0026]
MEDNPPHVQLRSHCGACGRAFVARQRIGALLGSHGAPRCRYIDAALFPPNYFCHQGNANVIFCRTVNCELCAESAETATIHVDCFVLFMKRCTAPNRLQRLWVASTWRDPWPKAPLSILNPVAHRWDCIEEIPKTYNLPGFQTLPPELQLMIWNYSRPPLLERYCSVAALADFLSDSQPTRLTTLPLIELQQWTRGSDPISANAPLAEGSTIHLTIDAQGLKEISRTPPQASMANSRRGETSYAIATPEQCVGVEAEFRYGLGRLRFSDNSPPLTIWDTPTPPSLERSLLFPVSSDSTRFSTANLRRCTGITFFIRYCSTVGVHVHTPQAPCALISAARLSANPRRPAWVYVPVSPKDPILAFGIRSDDLRGYGVARRPCFLLRMLRSGDLAVGPHHTGITEDFVSLIGPSSILVHDSPKWCLFSVFGIDPREDADFEIKPFAPLTSAPINHACFSSAPLQSIASTQAFYDRDTKVHRGILITYQDGTRRALGQCRVGLDPFRHCATPSRVCFTLPDPAQRRIRLHQEFGVKFEFGTDVEHTHDGTDNLEWICSPMEGVLQFWFSGRDTRLEIVHP